MRTLLFLFAALTVSACRCGQLDEGSCTGTWGGKTLDDARLDAQSSMLLIYRETCASSDTHVYSLSWGGGEVTADFSFDGTAGPSSLSSRDYALPPATFKTFSVSPNPPAPEGMLTLGVRGLEGDRTGTLRLKNATEELTCTFAVSYETRGSRPSCGGSGDGD